MYHKWVMGLITYVTNIWKKKSQAANRKFKEQPAHLWIGSKRNMTLVSNEHTHKTENGLRANYVSSVSSVTLILIFKKAWNKLNDHKGSGVGSRPFLFAERKSASVY